MKKFKLFLITLILVIVIGCEIDINHSDKHSSDTTIGTVATPNITIPEGQDADSFDFSQPITFSSATAYTSFYYTIDGTDPTIDSPTGISITLPADENNTYTVKVIAVEADFTKSSIAEKTFTKKGVVAKPVFSIGEGQDADNFDFSQPITFMSPTEGVTFHYTTNGITIPTTESLSGESITLPTDANSTYTVKVIAVKTGYSNSDMAEKTFTAGVTKPSISPSEGYFVNSKVELTCTTDGATIYYTTNGSTPDANSTHYSSAFTIDTATTVKAIAVKAGYSNSAVATADFKKRLIATVLVKAGSFSTTGTGTHNVTLTRDYYMGTTEVTQAQYLAVLGTNPSQFKSEPDWENRPVDWVRWYDAVVFCNALSTAEGLTPYYTINGSNVAIADTTGGDVGSGRGYRLPTEAEWEYAARGGQNTQTHSFKYAGTNKESELINYAWYFANNSPAAGTKPVGRKLPNALRLYDMSGNLGEWCWDILGLSYPSAGTNPTGAESGSNRIYRGSNWFDQAYESGVVSRDSHGGSGTYSTGVGFRVVRSSLP